MIEQIERLQRELEAILEYHQNYLDRRAKRGTSTATDIVMAHHQEILAETLDLLETIRFEQYQAKRKA